jgi:hypothetical protein
MKKIMMLFALCLGLTAIAQVSYPYKRPQLLVGKEVVVKPLSSKSIHRGYTDFYSDKKMYDKYKLLKGQYVYTDSTALTGRHFFVTGLDSVKSDFPTYPGKAEYDYRLDLKSPEGEVVYYEYETSGIFPFKVIGGLDLPADFYCDFIEKDKEGNLTTNDEIYNINVVKIKTANITKYKLTYDFGLDGADPGMGMTILFENGKKIDRPKTFVKIHGRTVTPRLNGSFELTATEIALLKESNIVSVKLNKYNDKVHKENAETFREAFKCLTTK